MDRRTLTLSILASLSTPSLALACFDSANSSALIHDRLPVPLPRGVVVLDVTLPGGDGMSLYGEGMRVRIRRIVQGDVRARYALLRLGGPVVSSCDQPFSNGRHGLIIGVLIGSERHMPVIRPVLAREGDGHRLPDGYQFPDGFDQEPAAPPAYKSGS
jgi:hypothetical protein